MNDKPNMIETYLNLLYQAQRRADRAASDIRRLRYGKLADYIEARMSRAHAAALRQAADAATKAERERCHRIAIDVADWNRDDDDAYLAAEEIARNIELADPVAAIRAATGDEQEQG